MLWGLLATLAILFIYPSDAKGNQDYTGSILQHSVRAQLNPITIEGDWPEPKRITRSYTGNCVDAVQRAGGKTYRTQDGYARTMPIDSVELPPEGVVVTIKTTESAMGHILMAKLVDGHLISVVEGGHSIGKGRIVPKEVYQGFIQ